MKNKRILIIVIGLILIVGVCCYFYFTSDKNEIIEILPEEEISDEQFRKTMVTLFYKNKENNEIIPEIRLIDVKSLMKDPYGTLINLLIEQPKNSNLESVIPKDTILKNVELKSDILYINFSKEFIENHPGGEEAEKNTINSIVNTLTELTEVNGIKILIDNEENKSFNDNLINFSNIFFRQEND